MTKATTPSVLAVDVGYGNTKMVCGHGLDKALRSRWTELVFPSIAPSAVVDEDAAGFGHNPDRVLIEIEGRRYYAGPMATSGVVGRVIQPDYINTDLHEVLLRAAIHFAMRESRAVFKVIDVLVLGLPVSGFTAQKDRLKEIGQQTREIPVPKFLQASAGAKTVHVSVKQCIVVPQPYGAMRLAAQDLPSSDSVFKSNVLSMVVDPGYRTLDWLVSAGMKPEIKLSGSYDGGVSSILREVSQQVGFDHGTGSLEFDQVERGLETGKINLGYKVIDMTRHMERVPLLASEEIGVFMTRIGLRRSNLQRVFLAGGGARFYEAALRAHLPECEVMTLPNPVMSNARGYWLTGCDALED
ncbi:ParM/StbA family protein [Hydrogenophaga sp. NFH-34]|uniref:ParM/StbA family protein n=1 Tax=Hydrogenophaga sp. NFH-34 TaxID=2744446 RepID=UPI001F45D08E|nr:ParM/StbA family protein [Hydrogenophaga sp. NFH-34]